MKATIDIDIGGTFTDCFINLDGTPYINKTPTTTYDLSVGFMQAIRQGARNIGISVDELVKATEIIRYSTTTAMNTLIQRKGRKLGLITTEGFEDTIFIGKAGQWGDGLTYRELRDLPRAKKPDPLIPRELVVGVKERIDSSGCIVRPLDDADVRDKVRLLIDRGARGFVVTLLSSYINPAHEEQIEKIIKEEYPESYLGSMPVVLSSKVLPKRWEYQRSMAAILNAYLHGSMADELRGIGDELRTMGYQRSMMMVHNSGGMAEVFSTVAIQTYNGGPVAGLIGGEYLGKLHGFENVIVADMGGTSFDLGLIVGGSTRFYAFAPVIDRWQVDLTMLETMSIGAGGGSIGWLNPALGMQFQVGPQGAGSMPGPACYDQGGTEPTVTDADVILGYINPDYFHGGRISLNKQKAEESIREKLAKPLQIDVVEAALMIKKVVDNNMGDVIFRETVLRGFDPAKFVLFAYGGAGPTHCCGYGFRVGVPKIVSFPFSPVFCTFGSANMDIVHIFEQSRHVPFMAPITKQFTVNYDTFNSIAKDLQERALKEIRAEGLPVELASYSLELDMKFGGQIHILRSRSPNLFLQNEQDCQAIYKEFEREYAEVYSVFSVYPEAGVDIENFALRVSIPTSKVELPVYDYEGEKPVAGAIKGTRSVFWEELGGFHETNIYDSNLLRHGNTLEGPLVIEAEDTTAVIPPGAKLKINKYHCWEIEKTV